MAEALSNVALENSKMFDGVGEKVSDINSDFRENGPPILDAVVLSGLGVAAGWAFFGLLGVGLGPSAPWTSDMCLNFAAFLGLVLLILMSVMIAAELALGVFLADFCHGDPLVTLVDLVNQHMDADNTELINFYLDCGGGEGDHKNPVMGPISDARDFTDSGALYFKQLGESFQCNDTSMRLVYGEDGSKDLVQKAIQGIQANVLCSNINPLFVEFTHGAMCDSTVSGLLSLFNTHVVTSIFLLITLHYASFVRPYMNSLSYKDAMRELNAGKNQVVPNGGFTAT